MVEEKKKDPQKGDFIDLKKTEFKKKNNVLSFLIKYIFVGLIFFGLGLFVSQKYKIPFNTEINSNLNQISQFDSSSELTTSVESLKEEINQISQKIIDSNLFYENLENKNKQLLLKFNDITKMIEKANEFDYSNSFRKELNQFELLKNFLILKNKFNRRQPLNNETLVIAGFFDNNFEVLSLLNFFDETDLPSIVKKDYLLNEINKKIKSYDMQLEDFFKEVKIENNLENKNIFETKEHFFAYVNEILNSTFKITKYEKKNFEQKIKESGDLREILVTSKEYLIIGNIKKALKIIEKSGIDLNEFESWTEKARELVEAQKKIKNLEELVLKRLVNYNDQDF